MRHNVPRLGSAAGWVHEDTGKPTCEPGATKPIKKPLRPVLMTQEAIEHTINIFSACCAAGEAPGENLQHAISSMLVELKRLKS